MNVHVKDSASSSLEDLNYLITRLVRNTRLQLLTCIACFQRKDSLLVPAYTHKHKCHASPEADENSDNAPECDPSEAWGPSRNAWETMHKKESCSTHGLFATRSQNQQLHHHTNSRRLRIFLLSARPIRYVVTINFPSRLTGLVSSSQYYHPAPVTIPWFRGQPPCLLVEIRH